MGKLAMLGFIILKWKHRHKTLGQLKEYPCPDCGHEATWHLVKRRRWLTIYYLPIIPLSRAGYWRVCPVCGLMNSVENVEKVKERARSDHAETVGARSGGASAMTGSILSEVRESAERLNPSYRCGRNAGEKNRLNPTRLAIRPVRGERQSPTMSPRLSLTYSMTCRRLIHSTNSNAVCGFAGLFAPSIPHPQARRIWLQAPLYHSKSISTGIWICADKTICR